MSKIEWTEKTWNPIVGCSLVSEGCTNCYAMKMAHRLASIPAQAHAYGGLTRMRMRKNGGPVWTGDVRFLEDRLFEPAMNKKPTMYFVNSMSDLFHGKLHDDQIAMIFAVMALCPQHTFQVLTKRPQRAAEWMIENIHRTGAASIDLAATWAIRRRPELFLEMEKGMPTYEPLQHLAKAGWKRTDGIFPSPAGSHLETNWAYCGKIPFDHIWMGVSIENQATYDQRIEWVWKIPARTIFISFEPLLGPIQLKRTRYTSGVSASVEYVPSISMWGFDWMIVGGESGPGARPMHPDWVKGLKDAADVAGIPLFFKQWGEYLPHCQADAEDRTDDLPTSAMRQFPSPHNPGKMNSYYKIGKAKAGHKLGSQTYRQFPQNPTLP